MRRGILILALLTICALLSACASTSAASEATAPTAAPLTVDLDLTRLSATVLYSQVYNMMSEPDSYLGKVIKMAGYYSPYNDVERGVVYHACVIPDAMACCAQGIEFVWRGDHKWPDDYPAEGTDLDVTGRLESYIEDGYMYLHLVDAEVVWG